MIIDILTPSNFDLWAQKTPDVQFSELKSACRAAIALKNGLAARAGWPRPDELAGEAWIRLEAMIQKGDDRPLPDLQLYAALAALQAAARENAHSVGGSYGDSETTGDSKTAAEATADARQDVSSRPTEAASLLANFPELYNLHEKDKLILCMLIQGYNAVEIGKALKAPERSIRYRVQQIKARIEAEKA